MYVSTCSARSNNNHNNNILYLCQKGEDIVFSGRLSVLPFVCPAS